MSFSLIFAQMTRVISSPSRSTTGLITFILLILLFSPASGLRSSIGRGAPPSLYQALTRSGNVRGKSCLGNTGSAIPIDVWQWISLGNLPRIAIRLGIVGNSRDQHAVDAPAIHIDDLEAQVLPVEPLSDDRQVPEFPQQKAGKGVIIIVGSSDPADSEGAPIDRCRCRRRSAKIRRRGGQRWYRLPLHLPEILRRSTQGCRSR